MTMAAAHHDSLRLTLRQFRDFAQRGSLAGFALVGDGDAFVLRASLTGSDAPHAVLVKTREDTPRRFNDPRKAIALLQEIGIDTATIDASRWEQSAEPVRRRPDSAAALRKIHRKARQIHRAKP